MLRDKEVAYREKDLEIRELKEKVVSLNSSLRKLEMKNAELMHQVKCTAILNTSMMSRKENYANSFMITYNFACCDTMWGYLLELLNFEDTVGIRIFFYPFWFLQLEKPFCFFSFHEC